MNCEQVRELLPLQAYGDLIGDEVAAVQAHVTQCVACRAELAALSRLRGLLNETPTARVDVAAIQRSESNQLRRTARRWRVAALVGLAAALLLAATRLEFRFDHRQLIVRWGQGEPVGQVVEQSHPPVIIQQDTAGVTEVAERMRLLNELVHALAANLEAGDRDRGEELAKLRKEIAAMRQMDQKRWAATERDVSALYTAQFGTRNPGANP